MGLRYTRNDKWPQDVLSEAHQSRKPEGLCKAAPSRPCCARLQLQRKQANAHIDSHHLSLTLSANSAIAAENISCPLLSLASGKPIKAQSISVFDGPPAEMAELVPDNADTGAHASYY